jgi:hypothetical protein
MKLCIYKWTPRDMDDKLCAVCHNKAYRTFYNDSKVGSKLPGWYVCYRKKCSIWISLLVLNDIGSYEL